MSKDGLALKHSEDANKNNPLNTWLLVEKDDFYALYNVVNMRYMGSDGGYGMRASATAAHNWEYFIPRQHPDGGYQLLSPHWRNYLRLVCPGDDGKSLTRRDHGNAVWEFHLVE